MIFHYRQLKSTLCSSSRSSRRLADQQGKQVPLSCQRDPLAQVTGRLRGKSHAQAYEDGLSPIPATRLVQSPRSVLQLQRCYGNRFVQRVLGLARAEEKEEALPGVGQAIQRACSGVQPLSAKLVSDVQRRQGGPNRTTVARGGQQEITVLKAAERILRRGLTANPPSRYHGRVGTNYYKALWDFYKASTYMNRRARRRWASLGWRRIRGLTTKPGYTRPVNSEISRRKRIVAELASNIITAGEIPITGATYPQGGMPLAFVLGGDPDARDVGLYFQDTLQVTTIFAPNTMMLSRWLLRRNVRVSRLILIFHGARGAGPTIWNKITTLRHIRRALDKRLLPKAVVEFWVCWGGTAPAKKRRRLKRMFGREIRAPRGKLIARANSFRRVPITYREQAIYILGGRVPVNSCQALYSLRRRPPQGKLLPGFRGRNYIRKVKRIIRRFERWLLRSYRHLVRTRELIPPRRRMSRRDRMKLMCNLLERSRGEIRYIRMRYRRRTYFPPRWTKISKLKRLWRRW